MQESDILTINFLIPHSVDPIYLCGVHDSNLRSIERISGVKILTNNDGSLSVKGQSSKVLQVKHIMEQMVKNSKNIIGYQDIAIMFEKSNKEDKYKVNKKSIPGVTVSKFSKVKPYTKNQDIYINTISMHDITFCIGPAGTGKTYIAVAMALHELQKGTIKKIVLTRPVVETDENLGFLPGTLEEKIDPYIRPLYDSIYHMLPQQEVDQIMKNGQLELAPLAYMRGRTLSDSFIILDEAQNTTINQMKMFLTRLGINSKMIVTGDITQIDLLKGESGLKDVLKRITPIKGIGIHEFHSEDTVRHGLVKKIIEAYEQK